MGKGRIMAGWESGGIESCLKLVEEYRKQARAAPGAEKIRFEGVGERDVYNITAPFSADGRTVIAGRVERRDSEESEVWFFVPEGDRWVPLAGAPVFRLQDPFVTRIGGELIFGGVETFPNPAQPHGIGWRTVMYRGAGLAGLEPFFVGPDQMKDLRLVEQRNGGIGVFTRPQGAKGGRGKIGYVRLPSLRDLTLSAVEEAPLLDQFRDEEWGGCNEIHVLSNGKLGVLGHIARFDEEGNRHYYPMAFALDPDTGRYSKMKILAERSDFLPGPAKRADLTGVVFSGGLVRLGDGTAELYAGIGDAEAQKLRIPDPFAEYER